MELSSKNKRRTTSTKFGLSFAKTRSIDEKENSKKNVSISSFFFKLTLVRKFLSFISQLPVSFINKSILLTLHPSNFELATCAIRVSRLIFDFPASTIYYSDTIISDESLSH